MFWGFSDHQMARIKKNEAFTAERERKNQQVVESVNELAQIMKDLSVLVIDQGTIVDMIDYNITNVAASVEDGLKQLHKAERSQTRWHGHVCHYSPHYVLCHASSLSSEGDYILSYKHGVFLCTLLSSRHPSYIYVYVPRFLYRF